MKQSKNVPYFSFASMKIPRFIIEHWSIYNLSKIDNLLFSYNFHQTKLNHFCITTRSANNFDCLALSILSEEGICERFASSTLVNVIQSGLGLSINMKKRVNIAQQVPSY